MAKLVFGIASYGAGLHESSVGRWRGLTGRTRSEVDVFCGRAYRAAASIAPELLITAGSTGRRAS
jgi:hypothetical protein